VDSLELATIARTLDVSVLDLLEDRPVPEGLLGLAARAQQVRAPGALDAARNRLLEFVTFDRLLDQLKASARPRPQRPELPRHEGPPRVQGKKMALALRQALGFPPGPLPDLLDVVEDLGLDVALEPLREGLAGLCLHTDEIAMALVDSSPVLGRQRFTVGHELCHYLIGDAEPFWVDEQLFGGSRQTQETRANAFAAHFLMPEEGIRAHLRGRGLPLDEHTVVELQHQFGVSLEALLWHLSNLRLISPRLRDSLQRAGPKALALRHGYIAEWAELERDRYVVRPPARLLRRALDAYERGLIGAERVAHLLQHPDPEQLRRELEDAGITPEGVWVKDTAPA
jgi:Zn-dependent peptidase ImmA (M78 family)